MDATAATLVVGTGSGLLLILSGLCKLIIWQFNKRIDSQREEILTQVNGQRKSFADSVDKMSDKVFDKLDHLAEKLTDRITKLEACAVCHDSCEANHQVTTNMINNMKESMAEVKLSNTEQHRELFAKVDNLTISLLTEIRKLNQHQDRRQDG